MRNTIPVASPSIFVTAVAWVFILLGGLASAVALVQNAAVASMMPWPSAGGVLGFLIQHLQWVVGVGLLVSLATLASAIGLLLRLDWARQSFIVLLGLALVAQLLSLWLQHEGLQLVMDRTLRQAVLPPAVQGLAGEVATVARVMAPLVTLAACAVLSWIMRRLMSSRVRREFV